MTLLVFGGNGQVGRALAATATTNQAVVLTRRMADLAVPGQAAGAIAAAAPTLVVNAAAYTAVDRAEDEPALCRRINAAAVAEIAQACADIGAALVHISTDYVFDGTGQAPLTEDAPTRPLNVYGAAKREGERYVLDQGGVVLRTSWVFDETGGNFVNAMLRLSESRDRVTVVGDQIGGPTPARAVAGAALTIGRAIGDAPDMSRASGVYHYQGAPAVSWAGFAEVIFEAARRRIDVTPIPTASYPTRARRPLYTVLDCAKIAAKFGVDQPDWRADLAARFAAERALNGPD